MPRYKNLKPSILGLSFKGATTPRTVQPGEVFEAEKDQIPQVYFDQKWVEETQDAVTNPTAEPGTTGQYEGSNPVQQSNTSALESTTDADAQKSGAYDPNAGTTQVSDDSGQNAEANQGDQGSRKKRW